jgi:hypothetical protein
LANITLITKKDGAKTVGDYRPIGLMHSVAKLARKIMANRLAPHLTNQFHLAKVRSSREEVFMTIFNTYRGSKAFPHIQNTNAASQIGHSKGI